MKYRILVGGLSVLLICICMADSIDDFASSLNQAWSQTTNDVHVLQLIENRLAVDSNDVLAVSAKMYYYVFSEGQLTNARTQADALMSIVNSTTTNSMLIAYAQEMRDEIYGIPLTESGPYTTNQIAQLRQPVESFPFIQKCVVLSRGIE